MLAPAPVALQLGPACGGIPEAVRHNIAPLRQSAWHAMMWIVRWHEFVGEIISIDGGLSTGV